MLYNALLAGAVKGGGGGSPNNPIGFKAIPKYVIHMFYYYSYNNLIYVYVSCSLC
jgi:hypothetical protein